MDKKWVLLKVIVVDLMCCKFFLCFTGLSRGRTLRTHLDSPLLMSQKLETHGCQWYKVKRMKSIFAGNEQGFGHLFIISIYSSPFFNKTDFGQYRLNKMKTIKQLIANIWVQFPKMLAGQQFLKQNMQLLPDFEECLKLHNYVNRVVLKLLLLDAGT